MFPKTPIEGNGLAEPGDFLRGTFGETRAARDWSIGLHDGRMMGGATGKVTRENGRQKPGAGDYARAGAAGAVLGWRKETTTRYPSSSKRTAPKMSGRRVSALVCM